MDRERRYRRSPADHLRSPRLQRARSCPSWSTEVRATRASSVPLSQQLFSPHASRESCSPGNGHRPDLKRPKANLGKFLDRAVRALLSNWGSNSKGTGEKAQRGWNLYRCPTLYKNPAKPCLETGERKEEIENRVLTTCASPLRLRSGRSLGPRADHRQDDASEGSPTLISSLGREEGGSRVMQIEVPAVGLGLQPPTSPRGEAPTRGRRGLGDCWRFAAVGARGREDCSSRPSYRRCRQPRRLPPRAARRGSSRAAKGAGRGSQRRAGPRRW